MVTPAIMRKYFDKSKDGLALVLGHEIAHLVFKHVTKGQSDDPNLPIQGFNRSKEEEADREGIKLARKAGYSEAGMLQFAEDFFANKEDSAICFSSHPSDLERLSYLDNKNGEFWQAYHTFINGGYFLDFEDYKTAESEFDKVVKLQPTSWEALNNRGYAKLMRYFEQLEPGDIKKLGIGYLVLGGYYKKPSIGITKGFDNEVWNSAVIDLLDAEKLYSKNSLAKANLGVAYLIAPDNARDLDKRAANLKKSQDYFNQALDLINAEEDKTFSLAKASIYNNTMAGTLALNDTAAAKKYSELLKGKPLDTFNILRDKISFQDAVLFNNALLDELNADKANALQKYGKLLETLSKNSQYREIAQDKFTALGGKSIPEPVSDSRKRRVYRVNIGKNSVSLSTTFDKNLETLLGCEKGTAAAPDEARLIKYFQCNQKTVEIAVGGERQEILLIRLSASSSTAKGKAAEKVTIEITETGVSKVEKVLVGMSKKEFKKIVGEPMEFFGGFEVYPNLNVYVKFTANNKVGEILARPVE
jgi:hypothetical protein